MAGKAATRERTGRVGQRRQVVIPRELFEKLHMRKGDLVAFAKQGNGVLVKPARPVEPDDELTAEQAKRLRRSLKQTRQGKTRPWTEIKSELGL